MFIFFLNKIILDNLLLKYVFFFCVFLGSNCDSVFVLNFFFVLLVFDYGKVIYMEFFV